MANTGGPWNIWLYGTNTKIATDDNNEVAIASLPTVNEVSGWEKVSIVALKDDFVNFDGIGQVQGGFYLDSFAQYRKLLLETEYYLYLTDKAKIDNIKKVFRKKQKFICIDGEGQLTDDKYPHRVHTSGKALEIKLLSSAEIEYETGWIRLDIELRTSKPVVE